MNEQMEEDASSEQMGGSLSIGEAARMLGVSERSVYGYVEHGRLPGLLIDGLIMVPSDAVACFERIAPGRVRVNAPLWHVPPRFNEVVITTRKPESEPTGYVVL